MNKSLFIGLLSGTSMDAIDAAVVDFKSATPQLLTTLNYPIPSEFRARCLRISQSDHGSIDDYGQLDAEAGELFSEAVLALLTEAALSPDQICAIGSHGQTLRHRPQATPPFSLQIGDPNIIAERTGIMTIADFRRRDIAAGGQGAPLAPAFHAAVFGSETENRIIVNIGGIANLSILPKDKSQPLIGFDSGPGNCLMDDWAKQHWGIPFDKNGDYAASGTLHAQLLAECLQDPYFTKIPPKSTGREYFNLRWLNEKINAVGNSLSPEDVQATLLALTVQTIASAIHFKPSASTATTTNTLIRPALFVSGGGAHNRYLMRSLSEHLGCAIHTTHDLGFHCDWVEALLFAWLAQQTLAGKSGNCPSVTGAKRAIPLGGIYGFCPKTQEPSL